jgi:hypothetical protein
MGFGSPIAFALAALALPIVVFYILRLRLRRVPVSTILFWRQIFDEKQPRSLWQRLRHLLSLLLQLAFLLLLVVALGDPYFDWQVRQRRHIAVIVDNSASMAAPAEGSARVLGEGTTRFEQAVQHAKTLIQGLRERDEMAVIHCGGGVGVQCGLTSHQRTLREAVDAVKSTDGPTQLGEAIALAHRILAGHETREIWVLSDGCSKDVEELTEASELHWVQVGEAIANVAITRFQARRSFADPLGYEVLVEVQNLGEEEASCNLDLTLEGNLIEAVPLTLEPNSRWSRVFANTALDGGRLVARLDADDALAVDNEARAILPKREPWKIRLASPEGNLFVEKVFEANPLVRLTVVIGTATEGGGANDAAQAFSAASVVDPSARVHVFHQQVPETLPRGNVVVVDPRNGCDLWDLGEALTNPVVTSQDEESTLLANVRLTGVAVMGARQIRPKGEVQVLAASVDDPLVLSFDAPDRKVLVLSADLDQSDLPLRTAFPILASNALAWFAGEQGQLQEAHASGSTVALNVERPTYEFIAPDDARQSVSATEGVVTLGPLLRCGFYRLVPSDGKGVAETEPAGAEARTTSDAEVDGVEIACNLANAEESDLRPRDGVPASAEDVARRGMSPLWFYLTVVAFGLVTGEWFLYQRRWIQ